MSQSDAPEKSAGEEKSRLSIGGVVRFFLWAALIFGVLVFLGTGILSRMGGTSDPLREGLEGFFSQVMRIPASIETLHEVQFYPNLLIDLEGLSYRKKPDAPSVMSVGKVRIVMNFWDVVLHRGTIMDFELAELKADAGILTPKSLRISKLSISGEGEKAGLRGAGKYGGEDLDFKVSLETLPGKTPEYPRSYKLHNGGKFRLALGELAAAGTLSHPPRGQGILLNDLSVGLPEPLVKGALHYTSGWGSKWMMQGSLESGNTVVTPDLIFKTEDGRTAVTGDVVVPVLDLADLSGEQNPLALMSALLALGEQEGIENPPISFEGSDVDIKVRLKDIRAGNAAIGYADVPVTVRENILTVGPLKGKISGGTLAGRMILTATKEKAGLDVTGSLLNWAYGDLQKGLNGSEDVSGKADIRIDLKSSGKTWPELTAGLNGKASLIAGQGKFASDMLNFWGAGLVNAMLPSLDPESETVLNCAIADFHIENGIAEAGALFLDTKRVTVVGKGTVNFPEDKITISLDPKAKDPAFIDVATTVKIDGPILEPDIGPSAISLGKKIGGLFLGTINPVYLAFSMTDLGLTDEHPCRAFIKEDRPEENPKKEEPVKEMAEPEKMPPENKQEEKPKVPVGDPKEE